MLITTQIIKSNDIDSLKERLNDFLKTINNNFIDIKLTQQDNWYTVLVIYRISL